MSTKAVAVEGMLLQLSPPVTGVITITSPPSPAMTVGGKKVYAGPMKLLVTNLMDTVKGSAVPGMAEAEIKPTAKKTDVNGKMVIRAGDKSISVTDKVAMKPGPNGVPEPSPITFTVEVKQAGQVNYLAD